MSFTILFTFSKYKALIIFFPFRTNGGSYCTVFRFLCITVYTAVFLFSLFVVKVVFFQVTMFDCPFLNFFKKQETNIQMCLRDSTLFCCKFEFLVYVLQSISDVIVEMGTPKIYVANVS